ncbi:MAG TPA: DUF4337 domain-containing protein [Chloroflexota bacterium]|nr:DUF4337 domain-containing protein [Chloroflexota bacterium]
MEPTDAADHIQEVAHDEAEQRERQRADVDRFRRRAAVLIGVLAMLLAIASISGENSAKEMTNTNILASDTWAFFQAKNIRQTSYQLAVDELETVLLIEPNLSPEAKAQIQQRIDRYKATIARYDSEPATGEGKKELTERAQAYEKRRDHAIQQDPNFDLSVAIFQIAIVLGSVSIVATSRRLLWLALGVGAVAFVLLVNGYLLFSPLPIG